MDYEFVIDNQKIDILFTGNEYHVFIDGELAGKIFAEFDDEFGVSWQSKDLIDGDLVKTIGKMIEDADM